MPRLCHSSSRARPGGDRGPRAQLSTAPCNPMAQPHGHRHSCPTQSRHSAQPARRHTGHTWLHTHVCMLIWSHSCTPSHSATHCPTFPATSTLVHAHIHVICSVSQLYHSPVQSYLHTVTHPRSDTHGHKATQAHVGDLGLHLDHLLGEPAGIIHHLTSPSPVPHCTGRGLED